MSTDVAPPLTPEATDPQRWVTASTGVREAAKWLAGSIGSIAAVVIGAGPLIDGDVDASTWGWTRWLLVLAAAAAAALSVLVIVSRLLRAMVPVEITLDALPKKLKKRIETNLLHEYLPGDAQTLEEFKARLVAYTRAASTYEVLAERATTKADEERFALWARTNARKRDVYLKKRAELYALAKYELEAGRLGSKQDRGVFALSVVLAAVSLTVFTLVTSAPDDEDEAGKSVAPTGAVLMSTPGSEALWSALSLDECEVEVSGGVPVLLLSEPSDDSYRVQTLGTPHGCGRHVFTVPADHVTAIVVDPIEVEVTVEEEPARR